MGMNRGQGSQQGTAAQRAVGFADRYRAANANQSGGIADRFRAQQAAQGRMARPTGPPGRGPMAPPIAPPPGRGGMGPARMQQQQMMAQQMRRGARPVGPPNPTGNRMPMRPTMGPGGRRNYR